MSASVNSPNDHRKLGTQAPKEIFEYSEEDMEEAYKAFKSFMQDNEMPLEMMRLKSSDLVECLQDRELTRGLSQKLIDDLVSRKVFITGELHTIFQIFNPLFGGPQTDEMVSEYRYLYLTRRRLRNFFARTRKNISSQKPSIKLFPTPDGATWAQCQ